MEDNTLRSIVQDSGNSDIDLDIKIEIETKSIAYAMLCSLFAKGELTESELQDAIDKLDSIIERDQNNRKEQNQSHTIRLDSRQLGKNKSYYEFPMSNRRRSWL